MYSMLSNVLYDKLKKIFIFIFLTFFFSVVVHHKEINAVLKILTFDFDGRLYPLKFS